MSEGVGEGERQSCDGCYLSHKRCQGGARGRGSGRGRGPCHRCFRMGRPCEFRIKKRKMGRPSKRNVSDTLSQHTAQREPRKFAVEHLHPKPNPTQKFILAQSEVTSTSMPPRLYSEPVAVGQAFSLDEWIYLKTFQQCVNTTTPITLIKKALAVQHDTPSISLHSYQAIVWAGVSMGAAVHRCPQSRHYLHMAKEHLRECFDQPCFDAVIALLAVANSSLLSEPSGAFAKYIGFALILYEEAKDKLSKQEDAVVVSCFQYMIWVCYGKRAIPIVSDVILEWDRVSASAGLQVSLGYSRLRALQDCYRQVEYRLRLGLPMEDMVFQLFHLCDQELSSEDVWHNLTFRRNALEYKIKSCAMLSNRSAAEQAAIQLLNTYEACPVFMSTPVKNSTIHLRLDVLQILLPAERFTRRIETLRRLVPTSHIVEGIEKDVSSQEMFAMSLKKTVMLCFGGTS